MQQILQINLIMHYFIIKKHEMIYKKSKNIFLINEKAIKNHNDEMDKCIKNSELFSKNYE